MVFTPSLPNVFGQGPEPDILDGLVEGARQGAATGKNFAEMLLDLAPGSAGLGADSFEFDFSSHVEGVVEVSSLPGASGMAAGITGGINFGGILEDASPLVGAAKGGGKGGGGNKGGDPAPPPPTGPSYPADTYTSGPEDADGVDNFNIVIEYYGDLWTAELMAAFKGAANFLSYIIEFGYASSEYEGTYLDDVTSLRFAEDLVIEAYISDIDGVGGVLGRAGPYDLPDSDGDYIYEGYPTAGLMEFDVADAQSLLDQGLWNDTVFHEMMHVIGFGTLWGEQTEADAGGIVVVSGWETLIDPQLYYDDNGTPRPTDDNYFYAYGGDSANAYAIENDLIRFIDLNGDEVLAIEGNGGSGTAGGHWDEQYYGNEIMTGYINTEGNYLAGFTIAALEDLGYDLVDTDGVVDYDALAALGTAFLAADDVTGMA